VVGTVFEHRPGRTVTETDNVLMTALAGNKAPIHLDR
jgi:itaconyl-CoA hydratase